MNINDFVIEHKDHTAQYAPLDAGYVYDILNPHIAKVKSQTDLLTNLVFFEPAGLFVYPKTAEFLDALSKKLRGVKFKPAFINATAIPSFANSYTLDWDEPFAKVPVASRFWVFVGDEDISRGLVSYSHVAGTKDADCTYNVSAPSIKLTKFTVQSRRCLQASKNLDTAVRHALKHFVPITPRDWYGRACDILQSRMRSLKHSNNYIVNTKYREVPHDELINAVLASFKHNTPVSLSAQLRERLEAVTDAIAYRDADSTSKHAVMVLPFTSTQGVSSVACCYISDVSKTIYTQDRPNDMRTYTDLTRVPEFIREAVAKLNVLVDDEYHAGVGAKLRHLDITAYLDGYWVEVDDDAQYEWAEQNW